MNNIKTNKEKQKRIGEQRINSLSASTITYYLFENIIKPNSTKERLYILYSRKENRNHPKFKTQKKYQYVSGFRNPFDVSNTPNIFFPSNIISEAFQETKQEIIYKK